MADRELSSEAGGALHRLRSVVGAHSLLLACVGFAVTRAALLQLPLEGIVQSEVNGLFQESATKGQQGLVVYRDFPFEYPPLAFLFLLTPLPLVNLLGSYAAAFRTVCFGLDVLTFGLIVSLQRHRTASIWLYVAATTILGQLIYNRLDIALGFLLVLGAVLHRRSRPNASYFVFGLAVAFKIVPLFALPPLLAWDFLRDRRRTVRATVILVLASLLPNLLAIVLCGPETISVLRYHSGRGVQIESSWACLEMLLRCVGLDVRVYFSHGSFNLASPIEGALALLAHGALPLASLSAAVFVLLARPPSPWGVVVATLGTTLLASKVFSPQFLLFFVPLLCVLEASRSGLLLRLAVPILLCFLTACLFPRYYNALITLEPASVALLILRNFLLLALVVDLARESLRSRQKKTPRDVRESSADVRSKIVVADA